jgi:hypothetical protein
MFKLFSNVSHGFHTVFTLFSHCFYSVSHCFKKFSQSFHTVSKRSGEIAFGLMDLYLRALSDSRRSDPVNLHLTAAQNAGEN